MAEYGMAQNQDPIQAALADLQRIRQRRSAILTQKSALDTEDAGLGRQEAELDTTLKVLARYGVTAQQGASAMASDAPTAPKVIWSKGSPAEQVMQTVVRLLRRHGDTDKDALYDMVVASCQKINGAQPKDYFSTILSRNKKAFGIDTSRRRGWYIVEGASDHHAPASGGDLGQTEQPAA